MLLPLYPLLALFQRDCLVTRPRCEELRHFRNKWYINTGAIWHGNLKEIEECTFAGEPFGRIVADVTE